MNNIIEYSGLAKELPINIKAYKQFNISKIIEIEENRAGIKDIIKVVASSYITNQRIIKTAEGEALDGEKLTGIKYLIKGAMDLKIYYEEDNLIGLLGVKTASVKFYNGVVLGKEFMSSNNLILNIYIEDIYSEIINDRKLLVAITVTAVVEGDSEYE